MTAHFIAKLVEKKLNDINLDNAAGVKDFNIADGLLNEYTRMAPLGKVCGRVDTHNFKCSRFLNFEITEIVNTPSLIVIIELGLKIGIGLMDGCMEIKLQHCKNILTNFTNFTSCRFSVNSVAENIPPPFLRWGF